MYSSPEVNFSMLTVSGSSHVGGPEGALAADREGTLVGEVVSAAASVGQSWKVVSGAGCLKGATPLYSRMALFLPLPYITASGILFLLADTRKIPDTSDWFKNLSRFLVTS
jgi:hypothetical protein